MRSLVMVGVAVVQVLRGVAHRERLGVDDLLGHDPRVRVDALAHRVPAHVLDAAGDDDVVGTEGDAGRGGGHRGHRAGAHAVDREAGDGLGEAGQQGGGPADGQALVADLRGGRDGHLVDLLRRECRVAAEQLSDALDDEVIGAGLGVLALGLAERGAYAIDEDDVAQLSGQQLLLTGRDAAAMLLTVTLGRHGRVCGPHHHAPRGNNTGVRGGCPLRSKNDCRSG